MATVQQRVAAVTNYTLEYFQHWHEVAVFELAAARMMLAAGGGTAQAHTCEQTFRHIRFGTSKGEDDGVTSALLLRALALLRVGELHTVRVTDPSVAKFILSALVQREENITGDVKGKAQRVFAPLRVVEWGERASDPGAVFPLIERYAATITELNCPVESQCDAANNLLTRCIQLESLTDACYYAPSAWLQLSQLHTLREVNLSVVSMAAIASALPRLHTLHVFSYSTALPAAAVAGFFEDLLPRLEDFASTQWWPQDPISQATASLHAPPPLPRLRTLTLFGNQAPWAGFMGARPLKLSTDATIIGRWLSHNAVDDGTTAAVCPLARVRTLEICAGSAIEFTPTTVARILRAAPNVETLTVAAWEVDVDASWLAPSAHPAFGGLVHSKLRRIRCYGKGFLDLLLESDLTRLRPRPHFLRLREVECYATTFFVTPLESHSSRTSLVRRLFDRFVDFVETVLHK
jgi:hypothetical protein